MKARSTIVENDGIHGKCLPKCANGYTAKNPLRIVNDKSAQP